MRNQVSLLPRPTECRSKIGFPVEAGRELARSFAEISFRLQLTDHSSLIIGSQNLTTTSLLENRELSLALDTATAPDLIAAVESTFDTDYATASAQ